jgi:hypothetical protein
MQPGRDNLRDSYYLRLMRTGIGDVLRQRYDLAEPLPDKLVELLLELDTEPEDTEPEDDDPNRPENAEPNGKSKP